MNTEKFINYVREMRTYQKEYFRLAGMARKDPNHLDAARHMLMQSKRFETDVDKMLIEAGKEAQNV